MVYSWRPAGPHQPRARPMPLLLLLLLLLLSSPVHHPPSRCLPPSTHHHLLHPRGGERGRPGPARSGGQMVPLGGGPRHGSVCQWGSAGPARNKHDLLLLGTHKSIALLCMEDQRCCRGWCRRRAVTLTLVLCIFMYINAFFMFLHVYLFYLFMYI